MKRRHQVIVNKSKQWNNREIPESVESIVMAAIVGIITIIVCCWIIFSNGGIL